MGKFIDKWMSSRVTPNWEKSAGNGASETIEPPRDRGRGSDF